MVILLYFKSHGTDKYDLFSQGAYNFQNLRNEIMAIDDYEYLKISKLVIFNLTLIL